MEEMKETFSGKSEPTPEEIKERYEKLYGTQKAAVATLPTELVETLQAIPQLAQKISTIEERLAPPVKVQDPEEWVENIRKGDFKGARQALFAEFKKEYEPSISSAAQKAQQDAVAAMQTQLEIEKYISKVRSDNPDLAPYERYIKPLVEARVAEEIQGGKLKSPKDVIASYQRHTDAEVESMRNLRLQERGEVKKETLTRTKEVLGSPILAPTQTTNRTETSSTETVTDETPQDYITRRQQAMARSRGLVS